MNLMCPARILLLPGDVQDATVGQRIAQVYAGPFEAAAGASLADHLGVRLTVVPELVQQPDQELRSIADLHRGETVVVLGLDLGLRLPALVEHTGDGWTRVPTDNEVTLTAYEQAAEAFRDSIPESGPVALIELLAERAGPGVRVLELGSGTGRDALELERQGLKVRRTDAASSFVEMMRADGHEVDRLNALTDDFGGPYAAVYASAVFLHFDRAELTGVLKKAVRAAPLLAFTTREGKGEEWSNRFLDLPRHFVMWQEEPLRELLAATGWTVEHLSRGEGRYGAWFQILATRS